MKRVRKENPYREGTTYYKLFEQLHHQETVTRDNLIGYARKRLRLRKSAANASVSVVLSPRDKSRRGDRRGNLSAAGHLYFVHKAVSRKTGQPVYHFHWRPRILAQRRQSRQSVEV
jgi:hypothetical protein